MREGLRKAGGGRRAARVWLLVLLAAAASCAEPVERRVRLVVSAESGVDVSGQVDHVRVWAVASEDQRGTLCTKVSRDYDLHSPADLPIVVDYFPGPRFDYWVAFRVEWYQGGTMIAQREIVQPFPEEGLTQVDARLYVGCFTAGCLSSEQCVLDGGHLACEGLADGGPFSNPPVTTEPCDPTVTFDGGGDDAGGDDGGADAGDG
jgi:hypothetical protein